jgi:predicted transcriptional regulator
MQAAEFEIQTQTLLGAMQSAQSIGNRFRSVSSEEFNYLFTRRRRRVVRPQKLIMAAILDACRTPTVQHWIMVKARLGYDTFWKHMNHLVSLGMMNTTNDGCKTLYSLNEKGLALLQQLEACPK